MARTTYLDVPAANEDNFNKIIKSGNRFIHPNLRKKTGFFGRAKKAKTREKSLLYNCKIAWDKLTSTEKTAWETNDPKAEQHGWRSFVDDYCHRLLLDIVDPDIPTSYHSGKIGRIGINSGITLVKLVQYHPSEYYILSKVSGKKKMFEPVSITEILALPLQLKISFASNLEKTESAGYAKLYAKVRRYYQGLNLYDNLEIDLLPETGMQNTWQTKENTLLSVLGSEVFYNLYLEFYKVKGWLLFDNIESNHSGQNWARDSFCNDLTKVFTGAFARINPRWEKTALPEGSNFESLYYLPAIPGIYGSAVFGRSVYGKETWQWEQGIYGTGVYGLTIYGKQS